MSNRSKGRAIVSFDSQPLSANQSVPVTQPNETNLSDELELLVSNCVRYILLREYNKTLIKQTDINKYLSECHMINRNDFNNIMIEVCVLLVFDFKLIEICFFFRQRNVCLHCLDYV